MRIEADFRCRNRRHSSLPDLLQHSGTIPIIAVFLLVVPPPIGHPSHLKSLGNSRTPFLGDGTGKARAQAGGISAESRLIRSTDWAINVRDGFGHFALYAILWVFSRLE